MRLYDYTLQMLQLEEMLQQEVIDEETFNDTMESIEGNVTEKAENVARMMDNFAAQAKMLKEEEDLLKKKRLTMEKNAERLQESLETYLRTTGKDEIQIGMYKLKYRKLPPSVDVWDEDLIPEAYRTPQPDKLDKRGIAKALKDGEWVDGAALATDKYKFEVKK